MPISGWLSARFGRKRFFLTCIAGFTVASLLCGLAPSLAATGRAARHPGRRRRRPAADGPGHPHRHLSPEQRGMATAIYGIAAVVAPAIGPTLGGWITDNYEWRWIFLINVPVGVVLSCPGGHPGS